MKNMVNSLPCATVYGETGIKQFEIIGVSTQMNGEREKIELLFHITL